MLRRVCAAILVLAAVVSWSWQRFAPQPRVLVATADIAPGVELPEGATRLEPRAAGGVPRGALTAIPQGRISAAHLVPGDVVSESKLVPEDRTTAPGRTLVTVPIADSASLTVLSPGDRVTLVMPRPTDPAFFDAAAPSPPHGGAGGSEILATGAQVVTPLRGEDGAKHSQPQDPAVLLSLASEQAHNVAAAAMAGPVGLIIEGSGPVAP